MLTSKRREAWWEGASDNLVTVFVVDEAAFGDKGRCPEPEAPKLRDWCRSGPMNSAMAVEFAMMRNSSSYLCFGSQEPGSSSVGVGGGVLGLELDVLQEVP
ncbi:hypothetical protein VNO78_04152 [Psophocarpus tetragonolobus]|uniref:Uncharacterized protein n=1 Tax=Psophocarpus tetragonolobus TaxID=3891 RepID=A0AAN9XWH8_PSOTE